MLKMGSPAVTMWAYRALRSCAMAAAKSLCSICSSGAGSARRQLGHWSMVPGMFGRSSTASSIIEGGAQQRARCLRQRLVSGLDDLRGRAVVAHAGPFGDVPAERGRPFLVYPDPASRCASESEPDHTPATVGRS